MALFTYTSEALLQIRRSLKGISNLLRPTTWNLVRKLRLSRRRRGKRSRNKKAQRATKPKQHRIDPDNIRCITREFNKDTCKNKTIKLDLINMCSLNKKSLLLKDEIIENGTDICLVTETWIDESNTEVMNDLNTGGLTLDLISREGRVGGGIGLIHNSSIQIKQVNKGQRDALEFAEWKVKLKGEAMSLYLCGIYRPPYSQKNKQTEAMFLEQFTDYLEGLTHLQTTNNLLLIGDFNLDVRDERDEYATALVDLMNTTGMTQHIGFPTHRSGSTIDLVFTRKTDRILVNSRPGPWLSDHRMVHVQVNREVADTTKSLIQFRKIRGINIDQLKDRVSTIDGANLSNIEDLVTYYNEFLSSLLDDLAPLKTKRVTERKKEPWFNSDMKALKKRLRKCERIWRKYKGKEHWRAYKECRNTYTNALRNEKCRVVSGLVTDIGNDSKQLFKLVSNLVNRTQSNPMPDLPPEDISNSIAEYFSEKIRKIRSNLSDEKLYEPEEVSAIPMREFQTFNEMQIAKITSKAKRKSCEIDPLPAQLLFACVEQLTPIHTRIINMSLQSGTFAESWKEARVKPLLKKRGLDTIPANYRPVSNLSFLSKLTERAALEQLNPHMAWNGSLPIYQSAYRESYSCETALLYLTDRLLWAMENQRVSIVVACDLSAAFDTVDHGILLSVLEKRCGVSDAALRWFDSYLRPRSFRVDIGGVLSNRQEVTCSVPQGFVLGPQLFSVYASTLQNSISNDSITLGGFADDHTLDSSYDPSIVNEEHTAIHNMEQELDHVERWMSNNRLKMNQSKTEYVLFGHAKQLCKSTTDSLRVGDARVEKSKNLKLLGTVLDCNLTFREHVGLKCRTASYNLLLIRQIRSYLTEEACRTCVQCLVLSHLDYGNALYTGIQGKLLHKLQVVQNNAVRVVKNLDRRDSVSLYMRDLHWLPIAQRIVFKVVTLVHKALHGQAPTYLSNMLKPLSDCGYGLRSRSCSTLLEIPRTKRVTFAARSFSVSGPTLWNGLPANIRIIDSHDQFRREVKTHLFRVAYS